MLAHEPVALGHDIAAKYLHFAFALLTALLIFFFIVGLILLSRVNVKQAMLDSGNDPAGVII